MDNLSPDESARTNELLANMTKIMIQLSACIAPSNLNFSRTEPFVPTASVMCIGLLRELRVYVSFNLSSSMELIYLLIDIHSCSRCRRSRIPALSDASGNPHAKLVVIYSRFT